MSDLWQTADATKTGWEEAAMNTLRHGASLTLYEKLQWLEEIEEVFLCLRQSAGGRDAARALPPLLVAEDRPADPRSPPRG